MRFTVLIENHPAREGCRGEGCAFEHGLSLYCETARHRILSDSGQSGAFLENAELLGVDLARVDLAVMSHGHYDHCGGLTAFAGMNGRAKIYLHKEAFAACYDAEGKYIGIDPEIRSLPGLVLTQGVWPIDGEVTLFSGIPDKRLYPPGNRELFVRTEQGPIPDDFRHEQYMVLNEGEKRVLISGCAHNGIVNILARFRELFGGEPDAVISGFHLMKKEPYTDGEVEMILETGRELSRGRTRYYTGHCTGDAAIEILKNVLGERLVVLETGLSFEI